MKPALTHQWVSITIPLFFIQLLVIKNAESLCNLTPTAAVERHFYHQHVENCGNVYREYNITIADTPYYAHLRLINWHVRQLLRKKLGYHLVTFANETIVSSDGADASTDSNSTTRSSCNGTVGLPPPAMISIQPSDQPVSKGFMDAGPLGLSASYGIYMSESIVNLLWSRNQIIANTYTDLVKEAVIAEFTTYNRQIKQKLSTLSENNAHDTLCGNTCFTIIYSSPVCHNRTCAILLTSDNDFPSSNLENLIASMNLPLEIVYLGPHMASVLQNLENSIPVLIFTNSMDPIVTSGTPSFTRVRSWYKDCQTGGDDCVIPHTEFRKVIWESLAESEPLIYKTLKNVRFSSGESSDMMNRWTQSGVTMELFSCEWLNKSNDIVSQWIPAEVSRKPRLYIGGLFPIDSNGDWYDRSLVPAAQMAIDLVNEDRSLLREYELELIENDTSCDASIVLNIFTEYVGDSDVWPRMVGGLGPACSDTALAVAGLATRYNYVMISYAVEAMVLSLDRNRYKYFFRTIPQINEYAEVYVALFKELGWTNSKVSMLTGESSAEFPVYHSIMSQKFKDRGISLASQDLLPRLQYIDGNVDTRYGKYLDEIKAAHSHIIIMDVYPAMACRIMCQAYKKGMTMEQGYQWFLPGFYQWDWYVYKLDDTIPCTEEEMARAVKGYFTLKHSNIDKTGALAVGGMNGTEFERRYADVITKEPKRVDAENQAYPSEYGSYTYDAVWTFAKALEALYTDNPAYIKYIHSPDVAERYLDAISSTKFQGVSGEITFKNGDRSGTTDLMQYNTTSTDDNFLKATFIGNWSSSTGLWLNKSQIEWGPGTPNVPRAPDIGQECEWESLRVALGVTSCATAFMIVVIPTCTLLILLIIVGAMVTLRRAKRKYRLAAELVSRFGEDRAYSTMLNLDEKEIPRDNVVLNRKLGEGAFGTVYGGEVFLNMSWTGVAVKSLKVGSNSEEKLDFLREADIMKRFEHKNIVKLLGVTTRGEPAYAIMEFMLYGDLKTYLLSRRELVGMDTKEAEDISAASLTRMSIDIIEGLNYLHQREYVHRDIACRNCLIAANRTVKIGDFGMTRRVYDDGCYLFTRRGKLPVRWMAPESFVDSVFTYKTDIWSYGVLLYEVITFGSIPYQMLTNAEVFEAIKTGQTLSMPEECTDELKSLMLACWRHVPAHRPSAIDIYAILKNNENMIQPLLSCPALAKITDCDTSAEMDMCPAPLKASTIFKKPLLRQSSSIISVDTGMSTFSSRHRNPSEVSYRRAQSQHNRRRSSHSIIDLFSLVHPGGGGGGGGSHPSPNTAISLPSPSLSTGAAAFHFPTESNRHVCDDTFCCEVRPTQCRHEQRQTYMTACEASEAQTISTENDYLLTTRSCTDIDDKSFTPLIQQTDETAI